MYINLDNITLRDARGLENLREVHDGVLRAAQNKSNVGRDEEFDLHLVYLDEVFNYLHNQGYIKE